MGYPLPEFSDDICSAQARSIQQLVTGKHICYISA